MLAGNVILSLLITAATGAIVITSNIQNNEHLPLQITLEHNNKHENHNNSLSIRRIRRAEEDPFSCSVGPLDRFSMFSFQRDTGNRLLGIGVTDLLIFSVA